MSSGIVGMAFLFDCAWLVPHSPYAARNLLPLIDVTIYK